jgi:hypothetical protein
MSWAMELSPAGFDEMLGGLAVMDRKTAIGWLRLTSYLRRFGSCPADESSLASIMGMTVRYLTTKAWPFLADRLVLSEDGARYFDPDITAERSRRPAGVPAARGKNPLFQKLANLRWGKRDAQTDPAADAPAHASPHAGRMRTDAETHAIPMRGASENDAAAASPDASPDAAAASPDASGASDASRAPTLSLSPSPLESHGDSEVESERESQGARMRDDAPAHAEPMRGASGTHAKIDASTPAPGDAKIDAPTPAPGRQTGPASGTRQQLAATTSMSAPLVPLPAGWAPSPEGVAEAKRLGLDPTAQAERFRQWNTGKGHLAADWDAMFLIWLSRHVEHTARHQQSLTMPIAGGLAEKGGSGFDKLVLRDGWTGGGVRAGSGKAGSNPVTDFLASEARKNAG